MKNKKAVILLSGGLDSVVSIAAAKEEGINVELALTFNYGQKSAEKELAASKAICKYYGIKQEYIELEWLKRITNTALVSDKGVPEISSDSLEDKIVTNESMKSVWVPNRNGLFINIAASFADSFGYDYIIIGANKEEASTFSDNSEEFIANINKSIELSTLKDVKVIAPLIKFDKNKIVQKAQELNVPLTLVNSCYNNTQKHCGKCESCNRLKRALQNAGANELIKELFL